MAISLIAPSQSIHQFPLQRLAGLGHAGQQVLVVGKKFLGVAVVVFKKKPKKP
jgi:hypothetical protein